ncbi:hypothetical protein ACWT_3470 [Actinoplanes sp. SE50]|uniref:hypothetical protein n=1 Tax=unclassified Actinoplanes TaxID=2626549 RepID=UPI00023EBB8C|nr:MULTISPECIES: hypothetical protein [unclassified Actinoplanes]AEV84493.1 hypothetical protein ACPL_3598 [Actinoplanes sp. SE50/110]ATO82885.1 hypothetical protein ACWT_3470 [Actinoplanes sp. SE50]SLM00293.1 hypothetical protein ACSP50_3525 [Actinoplanes sp. SE50/110]
MSQEDSEKDTVTRRGRRAAVVILGGLAAGAVLSGGAAAADPAPSIHDQFQSAFVAGPAQSDDGLTVQIVLGD